MQQSSHAIGVQQWQTLDRSGNSGFSGWEIVLTGELFVCSYLAEAGYRARTAKLEELRETRPLGIILDISPHSVDGWGILTAIKSNPATRDIPVLPVFSK